MRAIWLSDDPKVQPTVMEIRTEHLSSFDDFRNELARIMGRRRLAHAWSRYWPLVEGLWYEDALETGGRINVLASVLLDTEDVVYGPALLIGYDPTRKEPCSVPDEAARITASAWKYLDTDLRVGRQTR